MQYEIYVLTIALKLPVKEEWGKNTVSGFTSPASMVDISLTICMFANTFLLKNVQIPHSFLIVKVLFGNKGYKRLLLQRIAVKSRMTSISNIPLKSSLVANRG